MKSVLVRRKVDKKVNIEFELELQERTFFDKALMFVFRIPTKYILSRADLIDAMNHGEKVYTRSLNNTYTQVEVVNGKTPYIRSMSNSGEGDNIDSLPIYL